MPLPDWLIRWAIYAAMAVALFVAGFLKGCDHGSERYNVLTAKLQGNSERMRVITKEVVREVAVEKQAQVQFFGGWTHEVKMELAAAPVMPAECNVTTGLLNRGIEAANCAGRLSGPTCAAVLASGAGSLTTAVESVDSAQPSGDRPDPD